MKIGIFAPNIHPQAGGAYNFVDQLLTEISGTMPTNKHEFVILTSTDLSVGKLTTHILPKLNNGTFDKMLLTVNRLTAIFMGKVLPSNSARIAKRINQLIHDLEIDIVWSLAPNSIVFEVPYIATIWDLEHWNKPFFPEFHAHSGSWINTENTYRASNSRAALIIVGTRTGAKQLNSIYGIPFERILVNPFPLVPNSFRGNRDPYLILYPAQFWPHKNHLLLLKAIAQLPEPLKNQVKLVLTGADQGNLEYIKKKIVQFELVHNVEIRGFVSDSELQELYSTARITVFASYFGPDNLPPLESLSHGTLTAVADIPGARDYLGGTVIYFQPNDYKQVSSILLQALTDANWEAEKEEIASEYFIDRTWEKYVLNILAVIDEFSHVRENWA